MSGPAEQEWIQACREGRAEAYSPLVEGHYRRVLAVCVGMLGCVHEAEDAAQEAMIRAYRRIGTLRNGSAFGPWIVQIARNACVDALRRRRRESRLQQAGLGASESAGDGMADPTDPDWPAPGKAGEPGDPATGSEEHDHRVVASARDGHAGAVNSQADHVASLADGDEHAALRSAIARLPVELRLPLVLYYFDGKSVRGVAGCLGISAATVCGRLREARRALHEQMKGSGMRDQQGDRS